MTFRMLVELPGFRRGLESAAGRKLNVHDLDRLAVLAMLHDVGKANLGFQFKVFGSTAPRAGHVQEIEVVFADPELCERFADALRWKQLLEWFSDEMVAESLLLASWSHHGKPLCFRGETAGTFHLAKSKWWRRQGPWDPMTAVRKLMDRARQAFPAAFVSGCIPLPRQPRFHHRFAGLVMLADWLGSHPKWFPIEQIDFQLRLEKDRHVVPILLKTVGLDTTRLRPLLNLQPHDFKSRFGLTPRPLQKLLDMLDIRETNSRLLIAESETGSGKTEAALHWFTRLFAAGKVDSLYFALPTRVAARELYERINTYVSRFFPDPQHRPVTVLAVPGYARIDGLSPEQILPGEDVRWTDDEDQRRRDRQWAAEHPKRFLAATIAVGTIDQALLSTVQTAHSHLRSVCLDRSLLVVDEVHASGVYMGSLLSRLLQHHLAIGSYALLLSATLGSRARTMFLNASGQRHSLPSYRESIHIPYPSVTLCDGEIVQGSSPAFSSKEVIFDCAPHAVAPEKVIPQLVDALQRGARILVVMNTVKRANYFLRALEANSQVASEWLFKCRGVICPHHGRFAPADRKVLDHDISRRLGAGSPPGPVILVGTQTLEQSLDIDSDLLVTDLCPADVLLQRVGRLHRHRRSRPSGLETARCVVLVPETTNLELALDQKGNVRGPYKQMGYGSVYEDLRMLQLTLSAIQHRSTISIPSDNRRLVEETTHPEQLATLAGEDWDQHARMLEGINIMHQLAAENCAAMYDRYFGDLHFNEADIQVTTRLGADRLQLPLERDVVGPFGTILNQMIIPGHMKPTQPSETLSVRTAKPGNIHLQCGNRHYCYTRYGLEDLP